MSASEIHGRMTKTRLAAHLGEEHVQRDGRILRHVEAVKERERWSKDELVSAHIQMHIRQDDVGKQS